MMAQRYFDLRDPVNQAATVEHYGQVRHQQRRTFEVIDTPPKTHLHRSQMNPLGKFAKDEPKGRGGVLSQIISETKVDLFLVLCPLGLGLVA
jgi:hypothetical protein